MTDQAIAPLSREQNGLTAYLAVIAEYLIREHGLRPHHDNGDERVWLARQFGPLEGGRRRGSKSVVEYRLCLVKALDYLDFQVRHLVRRYRAGRPLKEVVSSIEDHVTADASGSIRRIYKHGPEGEAVTGVRTLSLKNYYTLGDEQLAQLLMANEERLAWIRELPVTYYPVANRELRSIENLDAFLGHFAGPGVLIPKRIQQVLGLSETIALLQIVPGNHLNDMAATIKRHATDLRRQPTASRVLLWYYQDVIPDEPIQRHTVHHYAMACRHLVRKANMRIRSIQRLEEERTATLRERDLTRLVDIRTRPEFVLERTDFNGLQLELIDTKERLWQEAQQMESCVDTYSQNINDGNCAIYHVLYEDMNYTLEVGKRDDGALYAKQLKGVRNATPPRGLQKKINTIFNNLRHSRIEGKHKSSKLKINRKVA